MDLSTYSLTFSVCFSYILKFVEEVALELLVRWDLNVIFLKEKRMSGLCATLRVLKFPILPNKQ